MRYKIVLLSVALTYMSLVHPLFLDARNAPVTTAGSPSVCQGAIATVPVTVTNFTSIMAITLRLDYDPTTMTFIDYTNLNPGISTATIMNIDESASLSRIMVVWYNLNPQTLTDGSKLFDLRFTLTAGSGTLSFNNISNSGGDCEYSGENGVVLNDIPTQTYYTNAFLTNIPPDPAGSITGKDTVCAGTSGIMYHVLPIANATAYEWSIPQGSVITSGETTNQIEVSFGSATGDGMISVKGINGCSSGAPSPDFPINMMPPQPAPVISASGALLTSSIADGNQWYYEGTGAIAGATGQTFLATITGWYWTVLTGPGCPSPESNHVYVLFAGHEETKHQNFSVFQVPGDKSLRAKVTSSDQGSFTIIVYNPLGIRVFESNQTSLNGSAEVLINLSHFANGLYSVVFLGKSQSVVRKVLIK